MPQLIARQPPQSPSRVLTSLLGSFDLWGALSEGATEGSFAYLELLITTLEDGELTHDEVEALTDLAGIYSFTPEDFVAANHGFLLALCHHSVKERRVKRVELQAVADLLDLPRWLVGKYLRRADDAART